MGCSLIDACRLATRLEGNMEGWRRAYCDTETDYATCARFEVALTGKHVPIELLPNGKLMRPISS